MIVRKHGFERTRDFRVTNLDVSQNGISSKASALHLTFDTRQPALECPEVFEYQQILPQLAYALPNRRDVPGETVHDGIRGYADEWRNFIDVPESRFDMQAFAIQFAESLLHDRVVVFQPVFTDIVDCAH